MNVTSQLKFSRRKMNIWAKSRRLLASAPALLAALWCRRCYRPHLQVAVEVQHQQQQREAANPIIVPDHHARREEM